MSAISMPRKLWEHQSPESTQMGRFRRALEASVDQTFDSFHDMYQFSIKHRAAFWGFSWEYFRIIHEGAYEQVVDELARIDSIPSWFPGVKLNFAENVLFSYANGDTTDKEDTRIAVTELSKDSSDVPVHLCWGELRQKTGALIQAMKAHGVVKGDRIASCSGNNINTMLVFLASTALGAIFSSSSTDMGVEGILDRLLQIKPSWLFMDDWAVYNGKTIDLRPKMQDIIHGLESVDEFQGVISQPRLALDPGDICHISKCYTLSNFLAQGSGDALEFEHVAFGDPLLIVYSSGTTGQPKCIVHSVGGVLMNTHKEAGLHTEIGPNSVNLQYTTTGWIMYLLSIQNLVLGSRVLLYDGSPFKPDMTTLIRVSARERVTHLGISPRWLYEYQRANISPRKMADLSPLQVVTSTGMVLPDSLFEWFYDEGFPATVRLNNISGGTDIAGCFGISNALVPVHTGGCAGFSLGIDVQVYDSTIEGGEGVKGTPIEDGVPGELVATSAFPNMPSYFWGDSGGQKYRQAYFSRFDNVWTHGDFVSIHPTTKQLMFHGRADGVLNPSGVRFGSAEIYRVIEDKFRLEVADCVCVGQRRPQDPDERVMLFLKMNQGYHFTDDLVQRVKRQIRSELSARHVPAFVFQTFEIPTTVDLKKVELPIKHIVSGRRIKPSGTLLNPKSLEYYYQFAEVEKLQRESKL